MADVFSPEKRSAIMSRVRSRRNQATELRFIVLLKKWRLSGWRRDFPIFGNPDFVFPKLRLAIFVDGCFWHACPLHGTHPENNRDFWTQKIARNVKRDRLVSRTLRAKNWRVLRIWQHELRPKNEARLLAKIRTALHSLQNGSNQ
jgi:DNA mismatch endonuclease (patch repair protein)